ncbi:kelch-like protein 2 [Melanaphis sacchari]|uniref:Kelch-like protein diablo n=2 Tax=Melanaphis sacchari TaxID=742174 RepID=A0A2H8TNL9_9HEMI|nr:kelch-like protein 2 [Melanaphis sacchari]
MSVKEMDSLQKEFQMSNRCEPTKYKNSFHTYEMFEVLQSLRKNEEFCDVKLQTDDGTIIFGHKNILVSATYYFKAMFSNFVESNNYLVNIKELNSTILQLLIDYIYTSEIMITEENVQVLLPAANLLQLNYVTDACVDFLKHQLDSSNALGISRFADLHNCSELLSKSQAYIKKQFIEITKCDEFLSLSSEELINLISCNDLFVPSEEKVFKSVLNWVKHELDCRKDFLPNLMKHVRLPLVSKQYLLEKVVNEPLLKNSLECNGYVFEALEFFVLKSVHPFTIPQMIRSTPRQSGSLQKVVLVLSWSPTAKKSYANWYDPFTKLWQIAPRTIKSRETAGLVVIKNKFVVIMGGNSDSQTVEMLDLSSQSPCWVQMVDMIVKRKDLGVGILDNCIYVVGGYDGTKYLNNAEVFDVNNQKWQIVSNMLSKRNSFGVGVLNNLLYSVGGYDGSSYLKTVECYDPSLNTWAIVAEMSIRRAGVGIGVLNGAMYAIGGINESSVLNSCEIYQPITGLWTPITNMHLARYNPGVFILNGLLYVMGGNNRSVILDSIEIYNPITNTWSMETFSTNGNQIYGAIVVDSPPHFGTLCTEHKQCIF